MLIGTLFDTHINVQKHPSQPEFTLYCYDRLSEGLNQMEYSTKRILWKITVQPLVLVQALQACVMCLSTQQHKPTAFTVVLKMEQTERCIQWRETVKVEFRVTETNIRYSIEGISI